jgi:transcriptional regulator with XRE-family HTH domain
MHYRLEEALGSARKATLDNGWSATATSAYLTTVSAQRGIARLPRALGEILRDTRGSRGLSLRAVETESGGRFRPSTVAGYERGDRMLSVERFCELAAFYRSAPEELLTRALDLQSSGTRRSVTIDLVRLGRVEREPARLGQVPEDPVRILAGFVHEVRTRRDDLLSDVITLRSGDLDALAVGSGLSLASFLRALRPALLAEPRAS